LYGSGTWSLILREEHRLRVLENRVLKENAGMEEVKRTGENYIVRSFTRGRSMRR
jgi:hypothetical protein